MSVVPLIIYLCFAQKYIQLQLYNSDTTRISQSLARNCNWRVGPWISVGQMLHVHVYDHTAWKPQLFFQMFGPKRVNQKQTQIFPKGGPGMDLKKIGGNF